MGLRKKTGLNVIEDFDFYPADGKIISIKERVVYPVGSNENLLKNIFYIFQKTKFNDYEFLKNLKLHKSKEEYEKFDTLLKDFLSNKEFKNEFEPSHVGIHKINFTKEELHHCFK